jgi:hypothetical protein
VSEVIANQLKLNHQHQTESSAAESPTSKYVDPSYNQIPPINPSKHDKFNLIHHRNISSDSPPWSSSNLLLQFSRTLISILLSSLTSPLNPAFPLLPIIARLIMWKKPNLPIYFQPYHKCQFYSLSGYFHVSTTMNIEDYSITKTWSNGLNIIVIIFASV